MNAQRESHDRLKNANDIVSTLPPETLPTVSSKFAHPRPSCSQQPSVALNPRVCVQMYFVPVPVAPLRVTISRRQLQIYSVTVWLVILRVSCAVVIFLSPMLCRALSLSRKIL